MDEKENELTIEQELIKKADVEKERADKLQKELEEIKSKNLGDSEQIKLEMLKLKEQNEIYNKKFQEITIEREMGNIAKEFPDVDLKVLKGTSEEMKSQAKMLQDHIVKAREDANKKIAEVLGTSTVAAPVFNGSNISPKDQEKIKRQQERDKLRTSGPRDEDTLAALMLNTKIVIPSGG